MADDLLRPTPGVHYRLTPQDGGRAQLALWQTTVTTPWRFLVCLVIFACLSWIMPLEPAPARTGEPRALISMLVQALGFTLALFAGYLLPAPWYGRRVIRHQRILEGEFTCSWNAGGLAMSHPNGDSRIRCNLFHSWIDAPHALLIRHSRYSYSLIPKRALASGQADDIVARLRDTGVREARRFGLIASPLGRGA